MSKVRPDGDDNVLYDGSHLEIRAIRRANGRMEAKEWHERLEKSSRAKFRTCVESLNNSFKTGRPDGRLYKLEGENPLKLHGIRVTKPKTRPHLRLLCVREGRTLWATHGFKKQKNETPRSEIKRAETIVTEWRELRDDEQG